MLLLIPNWGIQNNKIDAQKSMIFKAKIVCSVVHCSNNLCSKKPHPPPQLLSMYSFAGLSYRFLFVYLLTIRFICAYVIYLHKYVYCLNISMCLIQYICYVLFWATPQCASVPSRAFFYLRPLRMIFIPNVLLVFSFPHEICVLGGYGFQRY